MGLVDEAEYHFFHFFPYTDLPADHRERASLWVDVSNANYDPTVGHDLYNRYLSEMLLADKLGYDYAWEVEHHFLEEYSHSSAPEVFLAAAAARTTRIRLGHGIIVA